MDYEEKSNWTLGENEPKRSQSVKKNAGQVRSVKTACRTVGKRNTGQVRSVKKTGRTGQAFLTTNGVE